jgi:hypothetical protein
LDPISLTEDQAQGAAGRELANWATAVRRLQGSEVPAGVDNLNVDGRRVVGVLQGLGQLWRKTSGSGCKGRRSPRPR